MTEKTQSPIHRSFCKSEYKLLEILFFIPPENSSEITAKILEQINDPRSEELYKMTALRSFSHYLLWRKWQPNDCSKIAPKKIIAPLENNCQADCPDDVRAMSLAILSFIAATTIDSPLLLNNNTKKSLENDEENINPEKIKDEKMLAEILVLKTLRDIEKFPNYTDLYGRLYKIEKIANDVEIIISNKFLEYHYYFARGQYGNAFLHLNEGVTKMCSASNFSLSPHAKAVCCDLLYTAQFKNIERDLEDLKNTFAEIGFSTHPYSLEMFKELAKKIEADHLIK